MYLLSTTTKLVGERKQDPPQPMRNWCGGGGLGLGLGGMIQEDSLLLNP
jgi:hypothetical protein